MPSSHGLETGETFAQGYASREAKHRGAGAVVGLVSGWAGC